MKVRGSAASAISDNLEPRRKRDRMQGKMGRLLGCLVAAVILVGMIFPLSVSAEGGKQEGYVCIKQTVYASDGTVNGYYEYEYDNNGNVIEYTGYTANGTVRFYDVYEYDMNGNRTKMAQHTGGGGIIWYLEYEYEYDANGYPIRSRSCNADGSVYSMTEYEYDANGNLIRSATTYPGESDATSTISEFEYDVNGNIIKLTNYNGDGTMRNFTVYEYDASGNQTKVTGYNAKGIETDSEVYEYDANGNQTKHTSYEDGIETFSEVSEYDVNGNRIKYTSYWYGVEKSSIVYEYDANGNQIKGTNYNTDGSISSINIYEYALLGDLGAVPEPEGNCFATYDGFSFYKNTDGSITCTDSAGTPVINEFKCDGTYTYFFQADGTAMKDRLSYHPDGEHVIYFDENGHEVFSDFANVKMAIAGNPVDDFCFFDVYGYLYVDVVTYDSTGTVLYYANPYGVMERGKWFQFSDTVMYPGENGLQPWEGAAGGYGYANADGTLMKDQWTYDWEGRYCYMQGNGVALYE